MSAKKQFIIVAAAFSAILFCYRYIDQNAVWWAHNHTTPQSHELFTAITQFGDSTYYLIGFALLFFAFRFLWKKSFWEKTSLFLFAAVASSGILADIIKVIAGRYRPSELFSQGLYGFDFWHISRAMTSFPSGHSATAFALATAITHLWPKSAILVWPLAVLIAASRLLIGAHYPSDIIGGAVLGVFSTLLVLRYFEQNTQN